MKQDELLRIWIEQGNVNVSQLFFHHYKRLHIRDLDAMLIMHLIAFQTEGKAFPTPVEFTTRMHLSEHEVTDSLQRLMQQGFLQIEQLEDEQGVLFERFSLAMLWERLIDEVIRGNQVSEEKQQQQLEGEVYSQFEQEFGRLLSPMECETIAMWLDEDEHSVDIIRAALKEAVLAQKLSLRYIDRILFEWKKKKVKTLADVERQTQSFRTVGTRQHVEQSTVKRVPFYNWLEERE